MEEKKKQKRQRKKADFGPKIVYKDSFKTGIRRVSFKFQSVKQKRKNFPCLNAENEIEEISKEDVN